MAQSNRWYPQLRSAGQDLISAIKGAFDRIYTLQDRIDSIDERSMQTAKALTALDPSWTAYTPTITPTADMTITNLVISARYLQRGKSIQVRAFIQGQVGSVATNTFTITLPKPPVDKDSQCLASYLLSGTTLIPSTALISGGNIIFQFDFTALRTDNFVEIVFGGVYESK